MSTSCTSTNEFVLGSINQAMEEEEGDDDDADGDDDESVVFKDDRNDLLPLSPRTLRRNLKKNPPPAGEEDEAPVEDAESGGSRSVLKEPADLCLDHSVAWVIRISSSFSAGVWLYAAVKSSMLNPTSGLAPVSRQNCTNSSWVPGCSCDEASKHKEIT